MKCTARGAPIKEIANVDAGLQPGAFFSALCDLCVIRVHCVKSFLEPSSLWPDLGIGKM
jgi:hypothetical protein